MKHPQGRVWLRAAIYAGLLMIAACKPSITTRDLCRDDADCKTAEVCRDQRCRVACTVDSEAARCGAASYCGSESSDFCVPRITSGGACGRDGACGSGVCLRGTCCDGACEGSCKTCAGGSGACTTVTLATVAGACDGQSKCDASGACKKLRGAACDDAAECLSNRCVARTCGCSSDSTDCAAGTYCNDAAGTCISCSLTDAAHCGKSDTPAGCNVCGGATPLCVSGECACLAGVNDTCTGGLVCNQARKCVACTATSQCPLGACCGTTSGKCTQPEWTRIEHSGNPPPARYEHGGVFDAEHDQLVVFGGHRFSSSPAPNHFNDVWSLDLAGPALWTQLGAANPPSPRCCHASVYDPERSQMLVTTGVVENAGSSGETWGFSLDTPARWTRLTAGGAAPPRTGATVVYDPPGDRFVLFAGIGDGHPTLDNNDVWTLDPNGADGWQLLTTVGGPPDLRYGQAAVFDPTNRTMVIFAGGSQGPNRRDVWRLHLAESPPRWAQVTTAGTFPRPVIGFTAIYDAPNARLVVMGGSFSTNVTNYSSDTWFLPLGEATSTFTQATPRGTPPAGREEHVAIYDAPRERMLVFGGRGGQESLLDDTWSLSLPACRP